MIFAVSAIIALGLALLLRPTVSHYLLVRDLRSPDRGTREQAIRYAAHLAETSDAARRRLERSLRTDNDRQFLAVASALSRAAAFLGPGRTGEQLDRFAALQFEASVNPTTRWTILHAQCIADRANGWLDRLLARAVADDEAEVRLVAALLAAKLGDDVALAALLADEDADVRSAAAIDAALAGRTGLIDPLVACLDDADPLVGASAAHALAMLDPVAHSAMICRKLLDAEDPIARDRYLMAAMVLNDDRARDAVGQCFRRLEAGEDDPLADAMLLRAGAVLQADWAERAIRSLLSATIRPEGNVTNIQLQAALRSADELGLPVRKEVYDIVWEVWSWDSRQAMVAAARILARQADRPQSDPEAPSRERCIQALRQATTWEGRTDDPNDDQPETIWRTPMASAAAAVGLWELQTQFADLYLEYAAGGDEFLPGDYAAWHVATVGPSDVAYAVGAQMLPPADTPPEQRVYNDGMRAAGALLLALSARSDAEKAEARKRLGDRLTGIGLGAEKDPYLRHAYQCALLILGDRSLLEPIYTCTGILELPQWRTVTSLLIAGDRRVLDWALWNPQFPATVTVDLLVGRHLGDVAAALVPQLPRIDPAVPYEARLWQAKILADAYALGHASIEIAPWPPAAD
ncbi:MAG: HEAT repeat domain-containing protein [Planctomycetota bacterium]